MEATEIQEVYKVIAFKKGKKPKVLRGSAFLFVDGTWRLEWSDHSKKELDNEDSDKSNRSLEEEQS